MVVYLVSSPLSTPNYCAAPGLSSEQVVPVSHLICCSFSESYRLSKFTMDKWRNLWLYAMISVNIIKIYWGVYDYMDCIELKTISLCHIPLVVFAPGCRDWGDLQDGSYVNWRKIWTIIAKKTWVTPGAWSSNYRSFRSGNFPLWQPKYAAAGQV